MTPEEQVRATLEARYFDLRNVVASRMKKGVDSEEVDCVVEWAVSKCLRRAHKFDPAKGDVWKWVLMVAWGQIGRLYRRSRAKAGGRREKVDALEHVDGGLEGVANRGAKVRGCEEDALITAIDIKAGKYGQKDE